MSDACRTCRAPVIFAKTVAGHWAPFDAEPDPEGKWWIDDGKAEMAGETLFDDRPRYTSHFATCPDAEKWRNLR